MAGLLPGDPTCVCWGSGLVTRLDDGGDTGPEVCACVARKAREEERERLREAMLSRVGGNLHRAIREVFSEAEGSLDG